MSLRKRKFRLKTHLKAKGNIARLEVLKSTTNGNYCNLFTGCDSLREGGSMTRSETVFDTRTINLNSQHQFDLEV